MYSVRVCACDMSSFILAPHAPTFSGGVKELSRSTHDLSVEREVQKECVLWGALRVSMTPRVRLAHTMHACMHTFDTHRGAALSK